MCRAVGILSRWGSMWIKSRRKRGGSL
ncbi:MAG: hypothetical protein AB2L14_12235 [Candidatus Xenobiia bacterium LiM19]